MIKTGAYRDLLLEHVEEELGPTVEAAFYGAAVPHPVEREDSPMPFLSPDSWRLVRDGCSCGECVVCRWWILLRAEHFAAPNKKVHRLKTEHRWRWSSLTAALECYAEHRADGYQSDSASGMVERIGTMGHRIQARPTTTDTAATRAAEDLADMDRILAVIFTDENRRGLTQGQCLSILFARVVGADIHVKGTDGRTYRKRVPVPADDLAERYGVTRREIGEIVKAGRFGLQVELTARGLAPLPPRPSVRLQEAVARWV